MKEAIEKNNYLLNLRKKELQEKTESLEQIKKENAEVIEQLTKQYEELRAKKDKLTEDFLLLNETILNYLHLILEDCITISINE